EGGLGGALLVLGGALAVAPGLPDLALGGWPGGLLVDGVGVGDGGHGGQLHRGQHGPEDECACALGHGRPPIDQLTLCGRRTGWSWGKTCPRTRCPPPPPPPP